MTRDIILSAGATLAGLCWICGPLLAAGPAEKDVASRLCVNKSIDALVSAARNHYLPDGPENAAHIAAYVKKAGKIVSANTAFNRELGAVCGELIVAAESAGMSPTPELRGAPVREDFRTRDEGVSEITMAQESGVMVKTSNTIPCINAVGKSVVSTVRNQYLSETPENASARAAYGKRASDILTRNRTYNHELGNVCAKLIIAAKRQSGSKE